MLVGTPEHRAQVRDEINTVFFHEGSRNPPLPPEILEDCVSFAIFLNFLPRDREHFTSALTVLESRLREQLRLKDTAAKYFAGKRMKPGEVITALASRHRDSLRKAAALRAGHPRPDIGPSEHAAFSHLLSDVLAVQEAVWGFSLVSEEAGHTPKARMIAPLSANQFRAQLRFKRTFKDPMLASAHGEFTHRLQWYLAGISGAISTPADLYAAVGTIAYPTNPMFGLWDYLCDRDAKERFISWRMPASSVVFNGVNADFRCPEYFNLWLCSQEAFPFLATLLTNRQAKRDTMRPSESRLNYFAMKIHGRPYAALPLADQVTISRAATQSDDAPLSDKENASIRDGVGIFSPLPDGKYRLGG